MEGWKFPAAEAVGPAYFLDAHHIEGHSCEGGRHEDRSFDGFAGQSPGFASDARHDQASRWRNEICPRSLSQPVGGISACDQDKPISRRDCLAESLGQTGTFAELL